MGRKGLIPTAWNGMEFGIFGGIGMEHGALSETCGVLFSILFVANVFLCSSNRLKLGSERVHGRRPPPADKDCGVVSGFGR